MHAPVGHETQLYNTCSYPTIDTLKTQHPSEQFKYQQRGRADDRASTLSSMFGLLASPRPSVPARSPTPVPFPSRHEMVSIYENQAWETVYPEVSIPVELCEAGVALSRRTGYGPNIAAYCQHQSSPCHSLPLFRRSLSATSAHSRESSPYTSLLASTPAANMEFTPNANPSQYPSPPSGGALPEGINVFGEPLTYFTPSPPPWAASPPHNTERLTPQLSTYDSGHAPTARSRGTPTTQPGTPVPSTQRCRAGAGAQQQQQPAPATTRAKKRQQQQQQLPGGRRRKMTTRDDANYQCTVAGCGKLFGRSYNYKAHLETHDAGRPHPFRCAEPGCGRRFVRRADLTRHGQSVHARQKDFGCTLCGRLFARKDTLSRHVEDGCAKRFEVPVMGVAMDSGATGSRLDGQGSSSPAPAQHPAPHHYAYTSPAAMPEPSVWQHYV